MLLISISVICEGVSPLFISFSIVKLSFRVFAETVSSILSSRDLPLGKTVYNITNKTIQTIWNIIILETGTWGGMMYGT
jgi:hypothetical protein